MPRNLDHRIEMVVPVEAPHVRAEIETIFTAAAQRQLAGVAARRPTGRGSGCTPAEERAATPGPARRDARPRPRAAGGRRRLAEAPTCGSSSWRRACRGHRRRVEHRPAPRRRAAAASSTARRRCSGSARCVERTGAIPPEKLAETVDRSSRGFANEARSTASSGSRCSSRARAGRPRTATSCSTRLAVAAGARAPALGRGGGPARLPRRPRRDADGLAPADRGLRRRRRLGAGRGRHAPRRRRLGAVARHRLDAARRAACSTTTRRATRPSAGARGEVERMLEGFLPPAAPDRARGRRQRPRAARRSSAASSAPTSSTRSPASSPARPRARSSSSTASIRHACARSRPAR